MFALTLPVLSLAAEPDAGIFAEVELPVLVVKAPVDSRSPASVTRRAPASAFTVIDAASRREEAVDMATLLQAAPGSTVHDSGGAGQRKTLSVRGAAANATLVLLDGVPLSAPGQAVDFSRIPTAALESLEVLRGGASARYGPGAMGGVVNLVTRAPGGTRLFGTVTQGSFMQTALSAGGAGELLGGEALAIAHGLRSEGTFNYRTDDQPTFDGNPLTTRVRQNNQAAQGGALVRFRRAFGATQLDAVAEGFGESRGLAGPVSNPTLTTSQDSGRGLLSARLSRRFESGGDLNVLASARVDASTFHNSPFAMAPNGGLFTQVESGAFAEAVLRKPLGEKHTLTALLMGGGDWLREPTGRNPSWGRFGVMAADQLLLLDGALALDASARLDVAGPFVVVSPMAGVSVLLPKGFELKASGGQSSRPPSFQELYVIQGTLLPNPALRPERGLNADVSVVWKHAKARVQVTGFASLYEDLISYEFSPPLLAKPFNFLTASVVGLEVEALAKPTSWFEASGGYTFLSTSNLRDDPRYYLKALPFRPAHRVQARVAGGPSWLKARAELLYQSAQYTNRTETLAIAPRTFLNLGASVTPWEKPRVTLTAEVKNVLDVSSQDVDGYPLPPRAAFLTVALAWDEK